MIYILSILFAVCCFVILLRILKEFRDGFDWFSGALYFIIFLVSCVLVYILIFGLYYLAIGEIN